MTVTVETEKYYTISSQSSDASIKITHDEAEELFEQLKGLLYPSDEISKDAIQDFIDTWKQKPIPWNPPTKDWDFPTVPIYPTYPQHPNYEPLQDFPKWTCSSPTDPVRIDNSFYRF